MGREVSIAITAKDNFSTAINNMRNANQSFNKDLTGLQTKLDALNKTKASLKVDTDKAKKSLQEAEKQFASTGDAADKLALELANSDYENARRNLSLVSDNAKQAEKDIRSLTDAVSKSENRAGRSTVKSNGLLNTLAASGAASLLGNVASEIANTLVSSSYGSEVGTMFSSVLSSAGSGAAIGTMIAPGIGTAIGTALGGLVGAIQGQTKVFESKNEGFKSYVQDLYGSVNEAQSASLESGSTIAANREQKQISFSTLLGGDDKANDYLADMTDFAARTPFTYDTLANVSKTLLAYGYKQEELLGLLSTVGDAGSALGMSTEDMTYVATYLGRMKTTGKTTLEYLNPLLERGIPVWEYLAEASGVAKDRVQEMVSKGLLPGEEAAKAIADYMGRDFSGNMDKQSRTYSGLLSTLEDAQAEIDNAMGEGYNETRKTGMQVQIEWLSGDSGKAMQDAYSKIGQWQASLENLKEQYERDALESVMTGTVALSFDTSEQKAALEKLSLEYKAAFEDYEVAIKAGDTKSAEQAGAAMGAALAQAQAIAVNEYNASEGAQLQLDTQKTLADSIKSNTELQSKYWDAGYEMGVQFSKGMKNAFGSIVSGVTPVTEGLSPNYDAWQQSVKSGAGRGHAYGLSFVPYDNYPALLHEGERVLTASENRSYRGSSGGVVIEKFEINNPVLRSEDDLDALADRFAEKLTSAIILAS